MHYKDDNHHQKGGTTYLSRHMGSKVELLKDGPL